MLNSERQLEQHGTPCHRAVMSIPCHQQMACPDSLDSLEASALAELGQADWPVLQALDVSHNQYNGSGWMAQIAKSPWIAIQDLNLRWTVLGVDDAKQLGQLKWPQLKRLTLGMCFLNLNEGSRVSAMHYVSAGVWPELQALNVSDKNLSADSVAALVKGQWPALQNLDIGQMYSDPSPNFVQALAKAPWTALQDLNLEDTELLGQDISSLGDLDWKHITRLNLSNCFHGDIWNQADLADAMRAFTASKWPQLKVLDVCNNQMDGTVMHQLTEHLSSSRSLAEIRLGGNEVSYLSGLGSMNSLEHAPMSNWQHIRTMDLQDTIMSPEEVELLLLSAPDSLDTLYVSCRVKQTTIARPSRECWLCNTTMYMHVAAGPNLCEVLCSLSAGFWHVTRLDLQRYHVLSIEEVKELVKWDLSMLQHLFLASLGIGDPCQMPEMARVLSLGHWPNLRTLDLNSNIIDDLFVSILIGGKWPSLEQLVLFGNKIGEDGVRQLSYASWPHVTQLNLDGNKFNRDDNFDVPLAMEKRLAPLLHAIWAGMEVGL